MSINNGVDQQARSRALDCSQSFIIQAPAGSGKTELLTQRFLALLSTVEQPEEILAITFTRKAASEMRERIIKSLKSAQLSSVQPSHEPDSTTWMLGKKVLQHNELNKWDILENPQRLQVQTIDGFCASLTKRLPYLSGLGTEAKTTERPSLLYQAAAKQTLALINSDEDTWSSAISSLLMHLDGNQLRAETLLVGMLQRRDQWLRHLVHNQSGYQDFREQLQNSLKELIKDELSALENLFSQDEISEIQALCQFALENSKRTNINIEALENFSGKLSEQINLDTFTDWQTICRWLFTKGGGLRKSLGVKEGFPPQTAAEDADQKAYFSLMKQRSKILLEGLSEKVSPMNDIRTLPPLEYGEEQWKILEALMHCLKLATGMLKIIFSKKGEMDFQEVSLRALQSLGTEEQPTDLTLALDYQLKHILVDEFQDTSQGQFSLLEKLLRGWQADDGRSLFLVGDPMQSIYRFREADVGLFLRVRQNGIANIHPQALHLEVNFRSTQNIVNWVNQHFKTILPQQENISHGAVSYASSIAFDQSESGGVELYSFYNDKGELEAEKIAQLAQQHLIDYPGKTLAVLVRSRPQLAKIIPAFQQAALKFKATEIELLGHQAVVTDLQMLTRALTDPADRIAWLALLRGPWCGLSLDDLLVISADKTSSIMLNCQQPELLEQLTADGSKRLTAVLDKLLPWLSINHRVNVRKAIEGCWLSLDGPAYINDDVDLQAAELYFDLLTNLSQGGSLKNSQQLTDQLSLLYAPVASDANPDLQVMTIHKSKGLEFDTVILPDLNKGSANDSPSLLKWMQLSVNDQSRLLMAPIHTHINERDLLYDYLNLLAKKQSLYEAGRHLYVACTRAKRRLILTATLRPKADLEVDKLAAKGGSQLSELWTAVGATFKQHYQTAMEKNSSSSDHSEQPDDSSEDKLFLLRRVVDATQFNAETLFNNDETYLVPASPSHEQSVLFKASAMKRHIGTVTHYWLEQIADNLKNWPIKRLNDQQQLFKNQLKQLGVAADDLPKAMNRVTLNLQQTLSDDQGRYLLDNHQNAATELALERQEEDEFKNYIIDRTFIDEDDCRWIIDYKTSSHQGAGRDDFIEKQKQQYKSQLDNYATLFADLESRPIKLVLYFTRYQKLISWDWQADLASES